MELIARRLHRIQPSPSIAAMNRAKSLIAAGHDVCNLAAGEPDFATPPHIIEAAHAALRAGQTKYTATDGTPALKRAICDKFARDNGLHVAPEQVSVGAGAKQVIYNALACTLDEGDEVIVPAPYWVSYPDIVRLNGGRPVCVATDAAQGYKLTPAQLRAAIGPRTKWLVLNSPNNPSGAVYSAAELAALGEEVARHPHLHVLTDDIYEHLVYDGVRCTTFAQANPRLAARTLTVNGVSKSFAMTGWRIGYGAGPRPLIQAMETLQSQTSGNPASASQAAALAALQGPTGFLAEWRDEFRRRRDLLVARLDGQAGLRCAPPQGAFYVYLSCAPFIGRRTAAGKRIETDTDFVMYLLDDYQVATVQGEAYGVSPAFRLSFAAPMRTLEQACDRILQACRALA